MNVSDFISNWWKDTLDYKQRALQDGGLMYDSSLSFVQRLIQDNTKYGSTLKLCYNTLAASKLRTAAPYNFATKGYDMAVHQPQYGPELVTNTADRDFSSDTGFWSKTNATIGSGVCSVNVSSSINFLIRNSFLTIGKRYKATFDVISVTSGGFYIALTNGIVNYTTTGSKIEEFIAVSSTFGFWSNSFTGSIDNISVREVLTNDLTQTTAANQPPLQSIAPSERPYLINPNNGVNYMTHPTISFGASDAWTVECVVNWNGSNLANSYFIGNGTADNTWIATRNLDFIYRFKNLSGSAGNGTQQISKSTIGKNSLLHFTAIGNGTLLVYVNGVYVETLTVATNATFSTIIQASTTGLFYGEFKHHCIFSKALTPSEVASRSALLRNMFPEIETVPIGGQQWALRNADHVCSANGTLIADGTLTANWTTGSAYWCHNNGDVANGILYSKLYNKAGRDVVVANPPAGYHVATESELTVLAALGGNALKLIGNSFWTTATGTNTTGFSALGSGSRNADGTYNAVKGTATFWCADSDKVLQLTDNSNTASIIAATANQGHAIRLVKD